MKKFLENEFEKAVKLKKEFQITEQKKWTALQVANELVVQLGHYANILDHDDYSMEYKRKIDDKEDEISDILLQLCALCEKLDIKKEEIKIIDFKFKSEENSLINLMILCGQLTETIMEEDGYRHKKDRAGFISRKEFIIDRISRMFSIVFANENKFDYIKSFERMIKSAEKFLKEYKEKGGKE